MTYELLVFGFLDRKDNIVNYLLDIETYKRKAWIEKKLKQIMDTLGNVFR